MTEYRKLSIRRILELANLVSMGMSNKEIGPILGLTESTVKVYMTHACTYVGVRNRAELVTWLMNQRKNSMLEEILMSLLKGAADDLAKAEQQVGDALLTKGQQVGTDLMTQGGKELELVGSHLISMILPLAQELLALLKTQDIAFVATIEGGQLKFRLMLEDRK